MNYTLAQLQERVSQLIKDQGADAHCAAWIYTAEDCQLEEDNGTTSYPCEDHPELAERIFNDCLLYTSPSPRDRTRSRMPSSA